MGAPKRPQINGYKVILKQILKFVEWLTFLALLIGVGIFVQNVWLDYLSKATSVKQYTEHYNELEVGESKYNIQNSKTFLKIYSHLQ